MLIFEHGYCAALIVALELEHVKTEETNDHTLDVRIATQQVVQQAFSASII